MPRPVRILLFATARQAVGQAKLSQLVPDGGIAVEAFLTDLARERPELTRVLRIARFVRNGRYLNGRSGRVYPGDEFAIHPPYSGG
ncbi:MAG: MoaD/ThiS family protein [Thermoplasmata archaeon]